MAAVSPPLGSASRGASAAADGNKELTDRLLELRRLGRPPFLVRNLRYVMAEKARARRRLWDLNWTKPMVRAAHTPRHLVLRVRPARCILRRGATAQLLHPDRSLPRLDLQADYLPRTACCRLWLSVKQDDGAYVAFGLRNMEIRLWPKEHLENGVLVIQDFHLEEAFDLSAAVALIGSFPAALILIVEVFSEDPAAKPLNACAAKLRGEVCLLDRDVSDETLVPNGKIVLPLHFAPTDAAEMPVAAAMPRLGFTPPVMLRREDIHHGESPLPGEDIVMVEGSEDLGEISDIDDDIPLRRRRGSVPRRKAKKKGEKAPGRQETEASVAEDRKRRPDARIVLELEGTLQKAVEQLKSENKPRVYVTCWYRSQLLPFWDGIVRHDFVCPWCHRDCHRYRALLWHFQVEHDEMHFNLEGLPNTTGEGTHGDGKDVPFILKFEVRPAPQPAEEPDKAETFDETGGRVPDREEDLEDVYANPIKYGSYAASAGLKKSDEEVQVGMEKITISDTKGNDSDSASTEFADEGAREFLDTVRDELWMPCKLCQHRYHKPSPENHARGEFCSEYCEATYKQKMIEGDSPVEADEDLPPLSTFSSKPRLRNVDYKKSLEHLHLYHVVSMCEVKEQHFDESDPDSEEEVDHSWRLDLSLERVKHLDDATPKEKLLYMMWNKYAHENYPLPSFYAERYTRFTMELFALEYGPHIARLRLRLQFVGFLRALHIHGLIDAAAIKSIILCVDGKKKRRDCKISSRPDVARDAAGRNGRGRSVGSGRGRRGRRRNGV